MPESAPEKVPRSILLARQEWTEGLTRLQQLHRDDLIRHLPEAARQVHHLRALTGMLPQAEPCAAVVGWLHGTLETLCSGAPAGEVPTERALPLLASLNAACEVLFQRAGFTPAAANPPPEVHAEPIPPAAPAPVLTPRLPVLPPIRKLGRAASPLVQKAANAEEQDQPDESLLRDTDIDAQQALDELTSPGGANSAEAIFHKLKGGLYTARLNQAGFAVHTLESAVKDFRERENDPARLASFVAEAARRIASITTAALDGHTAEYEQLCRELRADAATLLGPTPLPPPPEPVQPPPEMAAAPSSLRSLALPYEALDELVHAVMRLSDEVSRLREMARPRPQEDDEIRGHLNGLQSVHRALAAKDRDGSFNLAPAARDRGESTRPGFALLDLTRETPVNQLLVPMLEAVDSLQAASTGQSDRFFELFQTSERVDRLARSLRERVLGLRLEEFSTLLRLFERAVKDTARREQKQVRLVVEGGDTNIDRRLLQIVRPALVQLLRNAVAHGIERQRPSGKPPVGTVTLRARAEVPGRVVIEVEDDGAGIDYAAIARRAEACGLPRPSAGWSEDSLREVLFSPGFSTREVADETAGRGQGMSVIARTIESAGGILRVASETGRGAIFRVELPAKLDYADLLFFACGDLPYAVRQVAVARHEDVRLPVSAWPKGSSALTQLHWPDGTTAPAILLPRALGLPEEPAEDYWPAIELHTSAGSLYLAVSRLLDSQSAHIRALDAILAVPPWVGAATSSEGRVVLLLDPTTLWESCRSGRLPPPPVADLAPVQRRRALVADDASSVRRALSDLLQGVGWDAELYTNGDTAWQAYQRAPERFDAVLTDLEMPHSNGYDLLGRIRALTPDKPVVVITSRAGRSHQAEAQRLGASNYLVKPVDRAALLPVLNGLCRPTPRLP
ncbi:MAG: response regulator [Verrucomicrobia bacterium]|nr:response regulator [Verrucomicrobiota bacterium]